MALWSAVLDACVLHSRRLTDACLEAADAELFRPRWSEEILSEAFNSILSRRKDMTAETLERRFDAMRRAFPDAAISGYEDLVESMTNDAKDRHVLAAAVRGRADVIVTDNLADFPEASYAKYDLIVQSTDEFLLQTYGLAPEMAFPRLIQKVRGYAHPPVTLEEFCSQLAEAGCPQFADELRSRNTEYFAHY